MHTVHSRDFDCPSAQPDMGGARPFGVVSGTVEEVRIAFFKNVAINLGANIVRRELKLPEAEIPAADPRFTFAG